ncbi:MAG: hypothetical protein ABJD97_01890 [Betaproteobacteria bacterium]
MAHRTACLAAVCACCTPSAQAALWSADPSLELSCGANDNYGLAFDRRNYVATVALNGGLVASRKTENMSTSVNANVVGLGLRGDLHQDEWQDSVTLAHSLAGPVDSFAFSAKTARDDTRQTPGGSADLLVGRGLQRSTDATASWSRALTERLSATSALDGRRTRYSVALVGARDFQNASASASLRYLVDERSSLNANVAHQDYRTLDDQVRSLTDSLSFGAAHAFSETSNASLALGAYRSRTAALQAVLVCPATCQQGQSAPVVVVQPGHTARWGLQYSASYDSQLSELTKLSASAARQQDPSGAGATVRGDSLRASVEHAFSETLVGSLAWNRSTSTFLGGVGGPQSRLQLLGLLVTKALGPRMTVRANVDYKRSSQPLAGVDAHSTSFAITWRYEWQRLEARR